MHASSLALLTPSSAAPQPSAASQPRSESSESSFASTLASSQPSSSSAASSSTPKSTASSTAKNATPKDSSSTAATKDEDTNAVQNTGPQENETVAQPNSEEADQGLEGAAELIQAALFIASEAVQLRTPAAHAEASATLTTVHGKAGAQLLADQSDTMAARRGAHARDASETNRSSDVAQALSRSVLQASTLTDSTQNVQSTLAGVDTQTKTLSQHAARAGLTPLAVDGSAPNNRALSARDADGLRSSLAKALNQSESAGRKANISVQLPQAVQATAEAAGSRAARFDLPAALQSNLRQEGGELSALSSSLGANGVLSTQSATSLATPLQGQLTAALHQSDWGPEFGRQMVHLTRSLADGNYQAELRLNPAELGPVRISLTLADNVAHAHIVSAHANVRHAIEQALPQLQQAMQQAGLSLGNTDVSDQGFAQSFAQDSSDHGSSDTDGHFAQLLNGEPVGGLSQPVNTEPSRRNDGLIDTFA